MPVYISPSTGSGCCERSVSVDVVSVEADDVILMFFV